jgi:hypothetical protein
MLKTRAKLASPTLSPDSAYSLLAKILGALRSVVYNQPYQYTHIKQLLQQLQDLSTTPSQASTPSPLPRFVECLLDAFLNDYPYIYVLLEHVYDHTDKYDVLKAVDSFLANLARIDVLIKENFHAEKEVLERHQLQLGQENSLKQIWEDRLCTRYGCVHVPLVLQAGGVRGEYHLSLRTLIPYLLKAHGHNDRIPQLSSK